MASKKADVMIQTPEVHHALKTYHVRQVHESKDARYDLNDDDGNQNADKLIRVCECARACL